MKDFPLSEPIPRPPVAPLISVVLPTYNERGNIERLIPALRQCLPWPAEYIVVDDDSPDGTAAAVAAMRATHPEIRLIRRRGERGLVSAIQRGIDESRGRIVVWMDCDFSLPPATVPELVRPVLEAGMDAAIGSRYVEGGEDETGLARGPLVLLQKLATGLLNRFTRLVMGAPFHDWTSGFIAIRSEVIRTIPLRGDYGEYFILLMAVLLRDGRRWVEVPYRNVPRQRGSSKTADSFFGLLRRGGRYLFHVYLAWRLKSGRGA